MTKEGVRNDCIVDFLHTAVLKCVVIQMCHCFILTLKHYKDSELVTDALKAVTRKCHFCKSTKNN